MNKADCTFIEHIMNKASSRKLIVFVIGTILFVAGLGLSPSDWMTLAMVYIGTQGAVDAFSEIGAAIVARKQS